MRPTSIVTATGERLSVLPAEWLATRDGGEVWLAATVENRRGLTDAATAVDFIGAGSWRHGSTVYLCEADGWRWLDAIGYGDGDLRWRTVLRAPDGYRSVRDADAAAIADGASSGNAYFARLEAERYGPEGEAASAAAVVAQRAQRWSRAANRELAADLRELGLDPRGDVWERAKALREAGEPLDVLAV